MSEKKFDRIIKNVKVVRPNKTDGAVPMDIAVKDGKFAELAPQLAAGDAREVFDGRGLLGFPGAVDAHQHIGIYRHISEDAPSETKSAVSGGVTSGLTYFRAGQYYLDKGGPYREFYPEVLKHAAGKFHMDYGFHIAPISGEHIEEMPLLLEHGVPTFKIFMFYGQYGLHGRSSQQNKFLMIGENERYDLGHFEFIMRGARKLMDKHPELADYISVSLHCEWADIMTKHTELVQKEGKLEGLRAYSEAKPPHSESMAIWIACHLGYVTGCRNINLLHLTSRKAVEAAMMAQEIFPDMKFQREATIGHLTMDVDVPTKVYAKVNPPIRPREDVEYLWQAVLDGKIHHVITDHACCPPERKLDAKNPDDIWAAKSGFGGTEYLLPGMFSEGKRRGLSLNRMAELTSYNAAQRFGLLDKGDIAPGYDADLALLDPDESWTVKAADSLSAQGYTPLEGFEVNGKVKSTFLRGELVYDKGQVVGPPKGKYLKRPYGTRRD